MTNVTTHTGGCHCGAVKYEIEAANNVTVQACNCSICSMVGFVHLIVPEAKFTLLSGADNLSLYQFNTGVAKHYFCKTCGVKSFYRPRSNPDGYSINVNCLDKSTFETITVEPFDGQNWEANAGTLKHLSEE